MDLYDLKFELTPQLLWHCCWYKFFSFDSVRQSLHWTSQTNKVCFAKFSIWTHYIRSGWREPQVEIEFPTPSFVPHLQCGAQSCWDHLWEHKPAPAGHGARLYLTPSPTHETDELWSGLIYPGLEPMHLYN